MTTDEIKEALHHITYVNPDALQLVAAVTANYLENGKDLTVPEIAVVLSWTDNKVRRILNAHGGCPNGLSSRQDERASYSKNYPAMQSGVHKVWTYGPTRETLRAVALRSKELTHAQGALIKTLETELLKPLGEACKRSVEGLARVLSDAFEDDEWGAVDPYLLKEVIEPVEGSDHAASAHALRATLQKAVDALNGGAS